MEKESKRTRQQRVNGGRNATGGGEERQGEKTRGDGARFGRSEAYIMQSMCSPRDLWRPFRYRLLLYNRPAYTLESLFARIRLLRERQDNPESSRRSAFPGTGSNRDPNIRTCVRMCVCVLIHDAQLQN